MDMVLPFKVEHLDLMQFKPDELYITRKGWRENLAALENLGLAYTYMVDGRVVLVAGFVFIDPGFANVWMLPSVYMNTYAHRIARKVKSVCDDIIETHHLHRIESRCPDNEDVSRWMQYLGFNNPFRCRKAGIDQTDLILWERVI